MKLLWKYPHRVLFKCTYFSSRLNSVGGWAGGLVLSLFQYSFHYLLHWSFVSDKCVIFWPVCSMFAISVLLLQDFFIPKLQLEPTVTVLELILSSIGNYQHRQCTKAYRKNVVMAPCIISDFMLLSILLSQTCSVGF